MKIIRIRKGKDRIEIRRGHELICDIEIANSSSNVNAELSIKDHLPSDDIRIERVNIK